MFCAAAVLWKADSLMTSPTRIARSSLPVAGERVVGSSAIRSVPWPNETRNLDECSWLAAIVHSSSDAIISVTLDCVMRSWNQGAERLYGYSAAEAIGQPISILIPHASGGGGSEDS